MNLILCLLLSTSGWAVKFPQRVPNSNESRIAARAEAAIRRLFGSGIEVAKERKPYFLTGDFNGDSFNDLLVVVLVSKANSKFDLLPNVRIVNPWSAASETKLEGATLAFAIIHGTRAGWEDGSSSAYLVSDREFFSSPIWQDPQQEHLLGINKRGRDRRTPVVPAEAKGDAISVVTEAGIDLQLYWDGKTYKLFTPSEEP